MIAWRDQAGFTLAELLVAVLMSVIVLAAAVGAFHFGLQATLATTDRAEAQQNARWALERMIQEIRGAGYDPTAIPPGYNFEAVVNQTATSLTVQSDLNGNGVLDAPAGCDPAAVAERVRYRLVGDTLTRSTDPGNPACEVAVVGGVQALTFAYLAEDGVTPALSPDTIRTVAVSVRTVPSTPDPRFPGDAVMVDRVRLRNR